MTGDVTDRQQRLPVPPGSGPRPAPDPALPALPAQGAGLLLRLARLAGGWYWEQDAQQRLILVDGEPGDALIQWLQAHRGESLGTLAGRPPGWNPWSGQDPLSHTGSATEVELRFDLPGGLTRVVSLCAEPALDAQSRLLGHRGLARDITRQKSAEIALRQSETRFRDFATAAGEYLWETDARGRLISVVGYPQANWGYSPLELLGRRVRGLLPPGEAPRVRAWIREHRGPDGSFRDLELRANTQNGQWRWLQVNAVVRTTPEGQPTGLRGTARDVTERKSAEARTSFLATRDPLTELPNRLLFNDRLEQGLVAARRSGQSLALMFIDLDHFKLINDSLGHHVGDLLLKEVASRMLEALRRGDTLSRLGGDEFVVTLEGLQQAEDAGQVAAKILRALTKPFQLAGHTVTISCSIGVGIFPHDGLDSRALMKNADTAMYHAKERGRNNFQFFSAEMNRRALERQQLGAALRGALEREEFTLYFQPTMRLGGTRVLGVEALLRWNHPERGLLAPATFMDVAEESGLMEPIGQWVLRTACQRAKAWQAAGYPAMRMAVNISPRQLASPREFSRNVGRALASSGLAPEYLILEMTEALLLRHAEHHLSSLRKLGAEGIRLVVDDFGTGFSSLTLLRKLPVYGLKIDRSFVRDLGEGCEGWDVVRTAGAIARSLGLAVVAEGVETRAQLEALAGLGVSEYQGFLFSKPLPEGELAARFLAPGQLDLFD